MPIIAALVTIVVVVAVVVTVVALRSGTRGHSNVARSTSASPEGPRLTDNQSACTFEADAGSDVLVRGAGSDQVTVTLLSTLDLTSDDAMTQIMISGEGAYNAAIAPPANATPDAAETALLRNNGVKCKAYGAPILRREQVASLEQLAGDDAVLLKDIAVFAANLPGGVASSGAPGVATTPSATLTAPRVSGCAPSDLERVKVPAGGAYVVQNVVIAPSDHSWARFKIAPVTPGSADTITGFAHCVDDEWTVVDYGSLAVGCRTVPLSLRKELDVIEC